MSLFDDPKFEAQMARQVRRRLLEAMRERAAGGTAGAPPRGENPGGVMGALGGDPDDDYFVDIERRDLPEVNPETGKPVGWSKSVHRFKKKRDHP